MNDKQQAVSGGVVGDGSPTGAISARIQRAETALSNAYESGDDERIQRAETALSDAQEELYEPLSVPEECCYCCDDGVGTDVLGRWACEYHIEESAARG